MRTAVLMALVGAVPAILTAGPAQAAEMLYASVWGYGDDSNHLVRIDVTSGVVTDVGPCTITGQPGYKPGLPGLSRHVDGHLYAFDTYGNQILRIDPAAATATVVTPVGADLGGWSIGLAVEIDGTYYVTDWQLRAGTLPGPTVPVGAPGISDTDSCDLAPDGTLYATNNDALLTINKTTGVQTIIESWPTGVDIAGIAIDGSIAWAVDNGDTGPGHQRLVSIDLATGDLAYLHTLPDGYYLATALPEPASAALLLLGGALLAARRKGSE